MSNKQPFFVLSVYFSRAFQIKTNWSLCFVLDYSLLLNRCFIAMNIADASSRLSRRSTDSGRLTIMITLLWNTSNNAVHLTGHMTKSATLSRNHVATIRDTVRHHLHTSQPPPMFLWMSSFKVFI